MAKYYIESGDLRVVIEHEKAIPAAGQALALAAREKLNLARVVMVNERGFIQDRENQQRYPTDIILETGTLLCMIGEHDLN